MLGPSCTATRSRATASAMSVRVRTAAGPGGGPGNPALTGWATIGEGRCRIGVGDGHQVTGHVGTLPHRGPRRAHVHHGAGRTHVLAFGTRPLEYRCGRPCSSLGWSDAS